MYRFAEWPNPEVPNWRAGVYTVWHGDRLVYVSIAGRTMAAGADQTDQAQGSTQPRGLRERLNSHASGRRSGDQFNIYVFDRLVLPTLSAEEVSLAAAGNLSLDGKTRAFIHDHLGYRFVVIDHDKALALEREIRQGAIGGIRPLLNPM